MKNKNFKFVSEDGKDNLYPETLSENVAVASYNGINLDEALAELKQKNSDLTDDQIKKLKNDLDIKYNGCINNADYNRGTGEFTFNEIGGGTKAATIPLYKGSESETVKTTVEDYTIKAEAIISPDEGNLLVKRENGLYAQYQQPFAYMETSSDNVSLEVIAKKDFQVINGGAMDFYDSYGSTVVVDVDTVNSKEIKLVEDITRLDCRSNNLQSLVIKKLLSLATLYCQTNKLQTLIVNGLTALTYLNCSNNQLQTLDVNGLPALEILHCGTNKIKELYVNGLTTLISLSCHTNQIQELDVSGSTALKELYCYNNQIQSLIVNGLTALTYLNCSNNQFQVLDISSSTKLTTLYCYKNPLLTTLDFPQFTDVNSGSSGFRNLHLDNTPIANDPEYIIENIIPKLPIRNSSYMGTLRTLNTETNAIIQPYLVDKYWTAT